MIFFRRAGLALLAALFLLTAPTVASAATFTVDSTGDEADKTLDGTCETNTPGECTLRAAIQESNASAGVKDDIIFDLTVFEGQMADTIAPIVKLPSLTSPVAINAGTCPTAAGVNGPCAGINGPSGEVGLEAAADETSISGLSLTGLSFAILVGGASTDFTARGNWIGVKLDGTAGANSNFGIFIDPDSDGATIGGTETVQRNVIANTTGTGLDLEGASEATIQGNYFGVGVDGETPMANGKNIEITGREGFIPSEDVEAEDNEVGASIEGAALTSEACDGGCNVISGALGTGVDLNGSEVQAEKPAKAPVVHGNFVGVNAAGTGAIPNGGFGILAGAADEATIGGPEYEKNANFIAGGTYGIYQENGDGFVAESNQIGILPVKADSVTPPSEVGIFVFGLNTVDPATIEANGIRMASGAGTAIEQRFLGSTIAENVISGGSVGILTTGSSATGSLVADNLVGGVGGHGILIKNDFNEVVGNLVTGSAGSGIRVEHAGAQPLVSATTGNVIGGDLAGEENEITNSGGDAIEIVNFEETANEVARNRGKLNGGLFIDLMATNPGTEPNGPNEGIQPPAFAALATAAVGSGAEEGALIRVFRKEKSEAGEVESFLGETFADVSGKWELEYPGPLPAGTILAATQTSKGGTSELTTATTPGSSGGGNGGGGNGGGGNNGGGCKDALSASMCAPPSTDTTAPKVTITKAPKAKSASTTAKFKFKANEGGSKFQCKLDKSKFKTCRSPKKYKKLKPGKHVFKVRAIDKAGNVGKPAKRKFTVLK